MYGVESRGFEVCVMMAVTLALISVLTVVLLFGLLAKYRKPSTIPGPMGLPYFGNIMISMRMNSKDIFSELNYLFNKYGGIFKMRMLGMTYIFVMEPKYVKPLLMSSTNINKSRFEYSFFRPMFNDGLIVSEGDKWRTRRKLLEPSFHYSILKSSLDTVGHYAEEYVSHLLATKGKPTEIADMIYLLTLKIVCETAMGVKLDADEKQQSDYVKASKICHDGVVYRYFRFWLFPDFIYRSVNAGKTFFKCVDIIHNFADEVIRSRKELFSAEKNRPNNEDATKKERNAFLDNLLELDDSNPGLLTESDIKEEVDTFMIAEKVYDEQMEIFGGDKRTPTSQDLMKMTYLEMVIKETLRLYPSIPFYGRLLEEDLQIDEDIIIPAGYNIAVINYHIHRSKNYWDNPEEFIPERFAPGVERHPFSFIPFSAGPRSCIGQKFAMMELKTIMSTVVRHCRLDPVTTSVTMDYSITLQTIEPIIIKVFPRNETGADA